MMKKLAYLLLLIFTLAIVGCKDVNLASHDHDGDGAPDHAPDEHGLDNANEEAKALEEVQMLEREKNGDKENLAVATIGTEELSKHNMPTDCYVAYNGGVYDITEFLGRNQDETMNLGDYCGTSDGFQDAFVNMNSNDLAKMFESEAVYLGVFA